ncbi:MAG: nucleotidyl transferase AbiEii/AbiGii toxin family protein [Gammaproteobacteria bacterium]|nr:nucleotidyl transferase AbiEii/AbiGii toxin family protein [Gammaproteobacteria bacterium]MBP9729099.1 nucleotidyl transferase AbiEii/AbiGii toxin family protein [Gammaproteobacteria bacterium]
MNNQQNSFTILVEKAMQQQGRAHMRPVIEKELLHYDILFALDQEGLLDKLTFQGGTALRLCYGAPRFSEDLDFVGGYDFKKEDLESLKACIEAYLKKRYDLAVSVKEPKVLEETLDERGIKINKWQIRIVTHPERPDFHKQMIKIEIANIPAYTREPRPLQANYDFLLDGYSDTLVMVETLDEIFADKLISLVNCQVYVRHRDIWDLHWLKKHGASLRLALIQKKILDYKITDYLHKVENFRQRSKAIIHGEAFKLQMSRFLPEDVQVRTLLKEKFYDFLYNEIDTIFSHVQLSFNEAFSQNLKIEK